jgi:hypothetical protein
MSPASAQRSIIPPKTDEMKTRPRWGESVEISVFVVGAEL